MNKIISIFLLLIFSFTLVFVNPLSVYAVNPGLFIVSDSSWKYSDSEISGWNLLNFDDNSWSNVVAPSSGICSPSYIDPINLINENGAQPVWGQNPVEGSTVYFRKEFDISDPISGSYRINVDDDTDLYINGSLVFSNHDNAGGVTYTGDITPYLVSGHNTIGLKVIDSAGICQSMQFELSVEENIPSVPEFGTTTGILALVCSFGAYMFMKSKQFIG